MTFCGKCKKKIREKTSKFSKISQHITVDFLFLLLAANSKIFKNLDSFSRTLQVRNSLPTNPRTSQDFKGTMYLDKKHNVSENLGEIFGNSWKGIRKFWWSNENSWKIFVNHRLLSKRFQKIFDNFESFGPCFMFDAECACLEGIKKRSTQQRQQLDDGWPTFLFHSISVMMRSTHSFIYSYWKSEIRQLHALVLHYDVS